MNAIDVTLTITMSLADWRSLEAELPRKYPGWKLGEAITQATNKLGAVIDSQLDDA